MPNLMNHKTALTRGSLAAVILVALAGCSTTGAPRALAPTGALHTIPLSEHRAPDPTATPAADGEISASQAPLAQLWAVTRDDPPAANESNPEAWEMTDFADAITTRCFPQLTTNQTADLTARYTAFLTAQKTQPPVAADLRATKNSYFDQATKLCM